MGKRAIIVISALDFWSMGEGRGGPALWQTLKGYAERGWQVHFITGNCAKGGADNPHENIHVFHFDASWLKRVMQVKKIGFFAKILWWLYFQAVAFVKAQRLRSKYKFDIVYGYEIAGVPVVKILSKLWNVPMVARFQGSIVRLVWMKRPFWKLRAWQYVLAYRISSTGDLVIMTNDGSQGDQLLAQMGVKDEKIRFWINGLDTDEFQHLPTVREARGSLEISHRYVLLAVSRLMRLKRVDRSIRALPDVVEEYPDTILVIVGDGPERDRLKQLAVELGVQEHVRFEGAVPHDEVPKYLAAADIFLSFYDWSNVGNPLLEAMMAGKCIVTLNNGDTSRFVKNEQNGVLLEYEDLPKLSEVIKELLVDEQRRNYLAANARKFAEERFWSWDERMDAEIQAVEALLK